MKITSLKLSKQLKEAGFPLATEYVYLEWQHKTGARNQLLKWSTPTKVGVEYPAPLADEIFDRLPFFIKDKVSGYEYQLKMQKTDENIYEVYYLYHWDDTDYLIGEQVSFDASLAEAAGKMWLYLKENNLL